MGLLRRFLELSTLWKIAWLSLLFACIVAADFWTGSDVTLRASYLVPVSAAAWSLGKRAALAFSVLSVALCLHFDIAAGLMRLHPAFVYSDAVVRLLVYSAAALLLGRLRAVQTRLDALAQTDPLTAIHNRRGFEQATARELRRAHRRGTPMTLLNIDLDGFKKINDTLGHAEGDRVLQRVASVLASGRSTDIAARLGGDEFVLLMPDTEGAQAFRAVERIRTTLDEAMHVQSWAVGFSIGVVTYREPPGDVQAMVAIADSLMYAVKRDAKGGVRYHTVGAEPAAKLPSESQASQS